MHIHPKDAEHVAWAVSNIHLIDMYIEITREEFEDMLYLTYI